MRSTTEAAKNVNSVADKPDIDVGGQFASVAVEVTGTGTFTGGLYIKGYNYNPANPQQLYTEDVGTGTSLGDGKITKAGIYRVAAAAIIHVGIYPSEDFASDDCTVSFVASETLPPLSIVGSP